MSNAQILGQRIRFYRKMYALTQKELAAAIGVAPLYIANIEQGRKGISLDKLIELCKWFNVSLSDILPMEEQDNQQVKEKWISEIVESLSVLEPAQVGFLKMMICSTSPYMVPKI